MLLSNDRHIHSKTRYDANARINSNEREIVQSLKPSIKHYSFLFLVLAYIIYLSYTKYGVNTITGLSIASTSSLIIIFNLLTFFTTRYVITRQGVLVKKGPFSKNFKEIPFRDIDNIAIKQGILQKQFNLGNLIIYGKLTKSTCKGVKKPYRIKELIKQEKAAEYERRTLLKKIL